MKTIERNIILLNDADYAASDLAVAEGSLAIAGTPISARWNKLIKQAITAYTAGSYNRFVIDFSGITPLNEGGHALTLKNLRVGAPDKEIKFVVWGDANATASEIAAAFNAYFLSLPGTSQWRHVGFAANVLTIDLIDADYGVGSYETDIVGIAVTNTAPVLPVGGVDAASLDGYDVTKTYTKYELFEEGTFVEDSRDIACSFHDTIYVDVTDADFINDWAAVVEQGGVAAVAAHVNYTEVPSA
jgi:hypothetical protein